MHRRKTNRWLLMGTIAAYCLIGVEIIIMISPFAIYFYSVYGPILDFLAASPLTSWTTEFFLPHMVFPNDNFIQFISYFQVLLVIGLVLFLSAAIPLYYGRFTGKGVVAHGLYSKIRHPQYLFLGISGFGLLLYWPRFIILVMYITMLFVYYLLARNEEMRMQHEQPKAYDEYMSRIPMFIPGEPGGRIFRALFGWIPNKWVAILLFYVLSVTLSVLIAEGLREYSISRIPRTTDNGMTVVSVFPRPVKEMRSLYNVVAEDQNLLQDFPNFKRANLVYIMPGDFFLMALVTARNRRFSDDMIDRFPEILEWHQHKFSGGLGKFFRIFYNFIRMHGTVETNYDIERLIFVQVTDSAGRMVADSDIFDIGLRRRPLLLVDVDADTHEILSVVSTSENNKWGSVPMPMF